MILLASYVYAGATSADTGDCIRLTGNTTMIDVGNWTQSNLYSVTPNYAAGKIDNAYDVSGATKRFWNDSIDATLLGGVKTIAYWEKCDNDINGANILGFRSSASNYLHMRCQGSGTNLRLDYIKGGVGIASIDYASGCDNNFHAIVLTLGAGGINFTGDAAQIGIDADTDVMDSNFNNLSLGTDNVFGYDIQACLVDEIYICNREWSTATKTAFYNGGSGTTFTLSTGTGGGGGGLPTIDVNITSPANGSFWIGSNLTDMKNTIYINGTFNTSSLTNCTIDSPYFGITTQTGTDNFSFVNVSAIPEGLQEFTVSCNLTGTGNGTDSVFIEIDLTSPTITINPNNFYNDSNTTILSNYTKNIYYFNISLFDANLHAGAINITDNLGNVVYTNLTTTTKTHINFTDLFNISNLTRGTYTAIIEGSDSHTSRLIEDYEVSIRNDFFFKYLNYKTVEGNEITIRPTSGDVEDIRTTKYGDRYDFNFIYSREKATQEYIVEAKKKIIYLENSDYIAHFVIYGNGLKGNWIDFNSVGLEKKDVTVTKLTDYSYRVTINKAGKDVRFNSVGGLNYNRVDREFIIGSRVDINGFMGISSIAMNNFSAILNNTEETRTNTTNGTISITLATGIYNITLIPGLENYTTITGTLNISENYHNLSYTFTQTSSITINILDEKDLTAITEVLDITIEGSTETNQDTTNTSNYFIYNLESGIHKVTIGNENYTSRTYYTTVTNETSSVIYAYLLRDDDGQDVLFNVRDTDLTPIENVRVNYYRKINSTYTLIAQKDTDFAGQSQLLLDSTIEYFITFNHSSYDYRDIYLTPVLTFYTIILTGERVVYESVYSGIRFKLQYNGVDGLPTSFNITQEYQNITFIVEGDNLEEIGVNLTEHSYICLPASCENITTTTTGQASITISIMANYTGGFNTQFFFRTTGGKRIYVNDGFIKVVPFITLANPTLEDMIQDIKDNTSPNVRTVIVTGISLLATGIGSTLGLIGTALILPALFITIFASLPGIELINPLLGLIMIIFSVSIYVLSQLKEI